MLTFILKMVNICEYEYRTMMEKVAIMTGMKRFGDSESLDRSDREQALRSRVE